MIEIRAAFFRMLETKMEIKWHWKNFEELTLQELYALLKLRAEVFVVEQKCTFLDIDGCDQDAMHLLGTVKGGNSNSECLACYLRVIRKEQHNEASFGRVVVSPQFRGKKLGGELVDRVTEYLDSIGVTKTTIDAQCYLEQFYLSRGFETVSESFLEDEIPHISMSRSLPMNK